MANSDGSNQCTRQTPMIVIKGMRAHIILGYDFLQRHRVLINAMDNTIEFQDPVAVHAAKATFIAPGAASWVKCRTMCNSKEVIVASTSHLIKEAIVNNNKGKMRVFMHNPSVLPLHLTRGTIVATASATSEAELKEITKNSRIPAFAENLSEKKKQIIEQVVSRVQPEGQQQMRQLLTEFHSVISEDKFDLGFCRALKHKIRPISNLPIHTPQFRIPDAHLKTIHSTVDHLIKAKCIALSSSAWNSPIFAVLKHDGSLRVVKDLRKINANSFEDKYSTKSTQ